VEEERKRGGHLPARPYPVQTLCYREMATYTPQVQRYLDVFGWQQVQVILFDDFTNDTARVYRETCAFLGVSLDFQPEFPIINASKRVRSRTIRNVLSSPPLVWCAGWRERCYPGRSVSACTEASGASMSWTSGVQRWIRNCGDSCKQTLPRRSSS
jgi:hypothetical protein